jgi:hypothetical protein
MVSLKHSVEDQKMLSVWKTETNESVQIIHSYWFLQWRRTWEMRSVDPLLCKSADTGMCLFVSYCSWGCPLPRADSTICLQEKIIVSLPHHSPCRQLCAVWWATPKTRHLPSIKQFRCARHAQLTRHHFFTSRSRYFFCVSELLLNRVP